MLRCKACATYSTGCGRSPIGRRAAWSSSPRTCASTIDWLQDITTHAINNTLYPKLPYDSTKDFSFVAMVASTPLMLVVHPSTQAASVRELIGLLKANPGKLSYGSSGNGTIVHLSGEMLKAAA